MPGYENPIDGKRIFELSAIEKKLVWPYQAPVAILEIILRGSAKYGQILKKIHMLLFQTKMHSRKKKDQKSDNIFKNMGHQQLPIVN